MNSTGNELHLRIRVFGTAAGATAVDPPDLAPCDAIEQGHYTDCDINDEHERRYRKHHVRQTWFRASLYQSNHYRGKHRNGIHDQPPWACVSEDDARSDQQKDHPVEVSGHHKGSF